MTKAQGKAFAEDIVVAVRKKLKTPKGDNSSVSLLSEGMALSEVTEWIPTGFKPIDNIFGGGWPIGRASEVYGMEGCGKSALAQMAIRQCQLLGGTPLYIDFEHALDAQKIESVGIDRDRLVYVDPQDVEEAWDAIWAFLDYFERKKPKAPSLIVWDSIAASVAKAENEESNHGDSHVALIAKSMDKGCRKMFRRIAKVRAHMLWINQQRVKFGGRSFIKEYDTPGGKQVKFAASLRCKMFKRKIQYGSKDNQEVVGYECNVVTEKCRLVPPHRKAYFVLDFLHGPSDDMTMLRLLMEARKIKSGGGGNYKAAWSNVKFKKVDWLDALSDPEFREGAEEVYAEVAEEVTKFHGSARIDADEDEDIDEDDE